MTENNYSEEQYIHDINEDINAQQQYEHELQLRSELFSIPKDKADLEYKSNMISELILDGNLNPIEVEINLKKFEDLASSVRKKTRENLLSTLDKYPEKTISVFGADITRSSRSTYDYSTCNDSELQELQAQLDKLNEKVKKRQEMLKHIDPLTAVNPETGEYLCPPSIKSTEIISIKIK